MIGAAAWGQAAPPRDPAIYTCIDDQGRLITRDRYIAECSHKEQRLLNKDGSPRMVIPPALTPDERQRREEAERAAREAEAARKDAIQYDRLLKIRYPNEAAHNKARESALEAPRQAIQSGEARL